MYKICSFFGHREVENFCQIKIKLLKELERLVCAEGYGVFLFGGFGDFDNLCAIACLEIQKKYKNCDVFLVTPYLKSNYNYEIKYDGIIYPPIENIPFKFAISHRNRWMIDKADVVIAYIDHSFGGAYKTFKYAESKNKYIINLANKKENLI